MTNSSVIVAIIFIWESAAVVYAEQQQQKRRVKMVEQSKQGVDDEEKIKEILVSVGAIIDFWCKSLANLYPEQDYFLTLGIDHEAKEFYFIRGGRIVSDKVLRVPEGEEDEDVCEDDFTRVRAAARPTVPDKKKVNYFG